MKLTTALLNKLIKEEMSKMMPVEPMVTTSAQPAMSSKDPQRFLHGYEEGMPRDDEGYMLKSRLASMKHLAHDICDIVALDDQLPAWVQDHIAVAHENLQQVHGYLTGDEELRKHEQGIEETKRKKGKLLSEAYARITEDEMRAWMKGDWGYVSEADEKMPNDYGVCDTCKYDHAYEWPLLSHAELEKAKEAHAKDDDEPWIDIETWVNSPNRTLDQLKDAYDDLTKATTGISLTPPDDIEVLKSEIIELQHTADGQ